MKRIFLVFALALFSCVAFAGEQPDVTENFANFIAQKKYNEAIDLSLGSSRWAGEKKEGLQDFKNKLVNQIEFVGSYKYHELIETQRVGERFKRVSYLIGFERQPIAFIFTLYKPDKEWVVNDISFNTDFNFNNGNLILGR
nr:hypothetical protein [Pseudomonas luteola]